LPCRRFFSFELETSIKPMPPRNVLVILLAAVVSLACYSVAAKNRYANLFAEVMDVVEEEALKELPREKLFAGAMNGMLKEIDRHSSFISDQGFREFREDMQQEFGGVGMYVGTDPETNMLMVLAPMPNTPAFDAGIHVGDVIVSIEGQPTAEKSQTEAVEKLRGPIGESVKLEIKRGEETVVKTLTRARIPVESAHGDYRDPDGRWNFRLKEHPSIGYIRLSQFGEKTADEMRQALDALPAQAKGLILDLRSNPGGLLDVAVSICDMFLEADLSIVKIRGREKEIKEEYYSTSEAIVSPKLRVCILVDRFSASASEIVSGCLQDHGRAILIGEQSYGKGTVQDVIPIQRNKSLVKLTTASYWRPSDKQIDRNDEESIRTKIWGVQPDVGFAIEMSPEEYIENLKQRSSRDVETLAEGDKATPRSDAESVPKPSQNDAETDGKPLKPHVDRPLQKAIEYLQSFSVPQKIAA
jgi:carboxyl-terminal processing protease